MPSQGRIEDQIYEAMRAGKGVPFQITTGGVKYEAVFQHKEVRDRYFGITRTAASDSIISSSSNPSNTPKVPLANESTSCWPIGKGGVQKV